MGAVAAAIARSARSAGAEIRCQAPVARLLVESGRVRGAVLRSGEELRAPLVVTAVHPKIAFLEHVAREELPPSFVADVERWKSRSGVVKINLALSELPNFTADPSDGPAEHHTGSVEMAPSMEYIEKAFTDAREGRPAQFPFSDGVIPTTLDRTLNPDGTHIFSLFTQWVPADWADEPHTDELEAYTDRLIDLYDEVAPGFKGSILHRDIVGPHEMETEYGLVGGNIFHGELSLEQLFHMRPAPGYADYRTPIAGLYNAGSATHGGGGVCGIPGWQAARAAMADRRRGRRRLAPCAGVSASVAAMLDAGSVAVVGASPRPDSFGNRMVIEAGRGRARTHLVNPRYREVDGRPCLPSVAEIGETVDLVLLGVGDHAVATELEAAAAAGARSAVVFGSAHAPGLRARLRSIARAAGMALCGAGCMGFVNLRTGLRALGYLERDPIAAGPVSLVTHSGSVFSTLLRTRRAIGFRLAVSSGQELVTGTADYLEYVLDRGDPGVVALVMETVREPDRLRAQLRRAAGLDVPVVLLPVGRSAAGSRLVSAHSGAVAGAHGAWQALTADTGALAVHDLAELTDTLELLVLGRRPRRRHGRSAWRPCTTPAPSGR